MSRGRRITVRYSMGSKLRRALEILRNDGLTRLLWRSGGYARSRASRRYSALRYEPTARESRIVDEDWDNLILLDACRFDQFERLVDMDGRLEARISLGSCTREFLGANFEAESCHDTVYVTANPMYRKGDFEGVFHAVVDVWESDWDETNATVRPVEMVAAVLEAHERYPHKRLIAHFVQPHYPFLGERGEALEAAVAGELSGIEWIHGYATGETIPDRTTPWDLLERGLLDEAMVVEAYDENLQLTLPSVEGLIDRLPGKTVVTSDHGNLVGERIAPFSGSKYGHPPNTHTDGVLKVPWFVVEGEQRREISEESSGQSPRSESKVVGDRLAALGYTEK